MWPLSKDSNYIDPLTLYGLFSSLTTMHKLLCLLFLKFILMFTLKINDTVPPFLQHTALPFKDISVDGIIYKNDQRSDGVPFSGQLKHEARKLQGSFGSQSVWRRAFGIEYLTMKNLRLG